MIQHTPAQHRKAQALLDSLPPESVVLDCHGLAWQEGGLSLRGLWYRAFGDGKPLSSWDLAFKYPIIEMAPKKGVTSSTRNN